MRGAVTFEAGGKSYRLRLTTNALCSLEEQTGKSVEGLLDDLSVPGRKVTTFRLLFRAALGDVTLDAAGELIDELGAGEADRLFTEVLRLTFPPRDASAEGNGAATAV